MFEFAIPAARILKSPVNTHQNETDADVLDRPEWVGFVPLIELLARWSTARRKRALGPTTKCVTGPITPAQTSAVKP